jgi:hypothetical protein
MKVLFHPEFPKDQRKFQEDYAAISEGLGTRFRQEIDEAIEAIKASPTGAGHFINTGSTVVSEFRRRNLRAFPFFVLYGCTADTLIFGSIIPTRSDPLNWLTRFGGRRRSEEVRL